MLLLKLYWDILTLFRMSGHILILKKVIVYLKLNLTGHPLVLFAKSGHLVYDYWVLSS